MSQIKTIIRYVFTNKIEMLFVFPVVLLWIPTQFYLKTKGFNNTEWVSSSIFLIYLLSYIFSYWVVSGSTELKKTYVWIINLEYRYKLVSSILIVAGIFSFILAIIYSNTLLMFVLYFLIAFGVICFNNLKADNEPAFFNLFAASFPLFLLLTIKLNISQNIIISLAFAHACVLIFLGYWYFKITNVVSQVEKEKVNEKDDDESLCDSEVNYRIGQLCKAENVFNKAQIDLLVSSPIMKYGFTGVLYAMLAIFMVFLSKSKSTEIIGFFVLVMMMVFTIITSRKLMPQTLKISHLFTGKKHKILKNKILFSLDKILLANAVLYVGIYGVIIATIGFSTNMEFLLISAIAVFLFGIAYYPIIIVYEGIPILRIFPPLVFVKISAAIIISIYQSNFLQFSIEYAIGFILACLLLRWFSQKLVWNTPYEKLIAQNY
ncbi:hypothetical protein [Marinicella sp. W31]|uniref:hypothetical protein n=1 Tax=Marinicella sp. W31 TaxID=3023713 RepID=UPI003757B1E6